MTHSALSLRAAVYLRASLKLHSGGGAKFDSRISIGIGEVEKIAESRISDSRGPSFTISDKNLDMMDRVRMMPLRKYTVFSHCRSTQIPQEIQRVL